MKKTIACGGTPLAASVLAAAAFAHHGVAAHRP